MRQNLVLAIPMALLTFFWFAPACLNAMGRRVNDMHNRLKICLVSLNLVASILLSALASAQSVVANSSHSKPRVVVLGVNGAEWDLLLPLILRGEMPNLARMMDRGVSGKLRTVSKPNCPKVYSVLETGVPPQE